MPRRLFESRRTLPAHLEEQLRAARIVLVFLDYDGTLTAIRKTPDKATLAPAMRSILRRLSRRPGVLLGLVTGRSMSDAKKLVKLRKLFFIADHGFEISANRTHWTHPVARGLRPRLHDLARDLKTSLETIRGVLVEEKGYTLSIHYRNVRSGNEPIVRKIVVETMRRYRQFFITTEGKKVIEIRPKVGWGKGAAILHVLRQFRMNGDRVIVYAGDDRTDEDAFKRLPPSSISIRVGDSSPTRAKYIVSAHTDIRRLLEIIDRIRRGRHTHAAHT